MFGYNFTPKWLRRYFKRRTNHLSLDQKLVYRQRLSLAYAFFAWNALFLIIYNYKKGRGDLRDYMGLTTEEDRNKPPAVRYAEMLTPPNSHAMIYQGFNRTAEFIKGADGDDELKLYSKEEK